MYKHMVAGAVSLVFLSAGLTASAAGQSDALEEASFASRVPREMEKSIDSMHARRVAAENIVFKEGDFCLADLRFRGEYRLHKRDVIDLMLGNTAYNTSASNVGTVYSDEKANFTNLMIGVDGSVSLPLVGQVYIAGLTLQEASERLKERLGEYYRVQDLQVRVTEYGKRRVYVTGAIKTPGLSELDVENMNILGAVTSAGGTTNRARTKHIQVLRLVDKTLYYQEINLDAYVKKHDMTQNFALEDGDIVYVPESNKIVFNEDILPYINVWAIYKSITD